jgi:hypothetical protein
MKTIKFMYNNFLDVATVTSLSTNADYPLTNLVHPWWSRANRTTDHDHQWWKWDLGATNGAIGISAFLAKYHNFYTDGSSAIGLYGHASDLGDTPGDWIANATLKVPLVYNTDYNADKWLAYYWTTPQVFKWWLLSVDDPSNTDGYLYLGRPFGGLWWSPTYNFNNAYSIKYVDPSRKRYSFGGQLSVTKVQTYRGMKYQFELVNAADMATFRSIFEDYVGQNTPYFICQDSDNKLTTTMYVENVTDWEIPHIFSDAFYSLGIELKESQ